MANERNSAGWHGIDDLEPGVLRDQIQATVSTINFQQLEKAAIAARFQQDNSTGSTVSCTIDPSHFAHGQNNIIFEIKFLDSVSWIARIQHISIEPSEASENGIDLQSEIATMRVIKERTTIPVPRIFGYDISPSNEIGHPYTLMERLPGQTLDGPIALHVPSEHLPKVARQLAEVLYQLHNLTFNRLGRLWLKDEDEDQIEIISLGPCETAVPAPDPSTSLEWFYRDRQEANRQALKDHLGDEDWLTACWVMKMAVLHIVDESQLYGPFPLCHLDLHHGNMLFDNDYNLVGVIDWSQAQTVPQERLVVCPEFITFPAGSDKNNQKIITLRELVRESLKQFEEVGRGSGNTSRPLLSQFVGSKRAEIIHRCTYSFPHRALWDARFVAGLIYGDQIPWEQLVNMYRGVELC